MPQAYMTNEFQISQGVVDSPQSIRSVARRLPASTALSVQLQNVITEQPTSSMQVSKQRNMETTTLIQGPIRSGRQIAHSAAGKFVPPTRLQRPVPTSNYE